MLCSGVLVSTLLLCLHTTTSSPVKTKHQQELKEHYDHLAYIAQFPCHIPQTRVVPVHDLFPEVETRGKAYFPDVTILHRCDLEVGCCENGQHCVSAHSVPVQLPFKITYLQEMGKHKRSSWEIVYLTVHNETECHCVDPPKGTVEPPKGTVEPPKGTVEPPKGTVPPPLEEGYYEKESSPKPVIPLEEGSYGQESSPKPEIGYGNILETSSQPVFQPEIDEKIGSSPVPEQIHEENVDITPQPVHIYEEVKPETSPEPDSNSDHKTESSHLPEETHNLLGDDPTLLSEDKKRETATEPENKVVEEKESSAKPEEGHEGLTELEHKPVEEKESSTKPEDGREGLTELEHKPVEEKESSTPEANHGGHTDNTHLDSPPEDICYPEKDDDEF